MAFPHLETAGNTDPRRGRYEGTVRLRSFDLKTTAILVGYPGMFPFKASKIDSVLSQCLCFKLVRAVLKIGSFRFTYPTWTLAEFSFLDDVIIAGQAED